MFGPHLFDSDNVLISVTIPPFVGWFRVELRVSRVDGSGLACSTFSVVPFVMFLRVDKRERCCRVVSRRFMIIDLFAGFNFLDVPEWDDTFVY